MEPTNQLPGGASDDSLPRLGADGNFRRNSADGVVAGVCVMLADRWRVDPLLVRVVAILLALSSGIGLVLYAAAWLMLPVRGSDRAPIDQIAPSVRRLGRKTGVIVLVAACIAAAVLVGNLVPFGIGPALIVAAVWYFGWYRPHRDRDEVSAPPEQPSLGDRPFSQPTAFTDAAAVWQQRVQEYYELQAGRDRAPMVEPSVDDPGYSRDAFLSIPDPVGLYAGTTAETPAPAALPDDTGGSTAALPADMRRGRGRARRRTGRMHLIGWALTLAALAAVRILDMYREVPFFAYPAAVLLAVGLTLVVGAWLPRPRGLVAIGVLLTLALSVTAAPAPETIRATVAPQSVADLQQPARYEMGNLVADLSAVRIDRDATYDAALDVGSLTVIAPPDANVRVEWSVDVGEARVLGLHNENGGDLRATTLSRGPDPDGPYLTIRAHVGLGNLEVRR